MTGNEREANRFTPTALFICGGLLIWATDFLIIYGVTAVACAKRYAQLSVAGLPLVSFVAIVTTLVAGIATAMLMRVAARRLRQDAPADAAMRFIHFLAMAIGAIAFMALLFNVLPALLLAKQC